MNFVKICVPIALNRIRSQMTECTTMTHSVVCFSCGCNCPSQLGLALPYCSILIIDLITGQSAMAYPLPRTEKLQEKQDQNDFSICNIAGIVNSACVLLCVISYVTF